MTFGEYLTNVSPPLTLKMVTLIYFIVSEINILIEFR